MNFDLAVTNVETLEEFIALLEAISASVQLDENRENDLFNALYDCVDGLLKGLKSEELERIMSCLAVSLPANAARQKRQAAEDRRLDGRRRARRPDAKR